MVDFVEVVVDTLAVEYSRSVAYHGPGCNFLTAAHSLGCIDCMLAGYIEGTPHHIVAAPDTGHTAEAGYIARTAGIAAPAERTGLPAETRWHWVQTLSLARSVR